MYHSLYMWHFPERKRSSKHSRTSTIIWLNLYGCVDSYCLTGLPSVDYNIIISFDAQVLLDLPNGKPVKLGPVCSWHVSIVMSLSLLCGARRYSRVILYFCRNQPYSRINPFSKKPSSLVEEVFRRQAPSGRHARCNWDAQSLRVL